MDKKNDVGRYRRKRSMRRIAIRLVVVSAILLCIAVIAANWSSIISPLKDAALDVDDGGFPLTLPGSTDYSPEVMGDNFCLLTDTYFYTYNSDGAMIMNVQHGLQNPVMSVSGKRALIYDRNGKDIKLYSRTEQVYSITTEDTIDFAEMSNDERCAVITKSTKYSNCLYVFNGEGKQIFRWASPLYLIDRAEFSEDDNSIFVSVCGSDNGELQYRIMRFDLDNADGSVWQTYVGEHMVYSLECDGDELFAVTAGGARLLSCSSGEITAQTDFVKTVSQIPEGGSLHSVLLRDSSGEEILTVYDDSLEAAALSLGEVTRVRIYNGSIYVLSGRRLVRYNSALDEVSSVELDDDYSDMIIIGGNAYLLGYNIIQRQDMS